MMTRVGGRTRAALLSASVVLAGGTTGAMAQQGSKAADERGRLGSVERMEQAHESTTEATAQPIAAEVKAKVVTGTVMLIDREARSVVLRDVDTGEEFSVQIPANAANFDQLQAGDRMDVNVLQPLELAPPEP